MDKKGERMTKKTVLLLALIALAISICGCNTIYRASKGAADGAVSGVKQDVADMKSANTWMEKNLW
jgi:hypothetical protein